MDLQPGQRVRAPDPAGHLGARAECDFVKRISDQIVGPYLGASTKRIPQAIVRYDDGKKGIWPLASIEADGEP